jgi:hypothetical protein
MTTRSLEARVAAASLIAAAALFWLSWYLMPQPGTTDASYILAAVARQRASVLASAIVQTLSAVATVPAMLFVARLRRGPRGSTPLYLGAALLLVGAIGNGADAVYHQIAYEMTAPGVDASAVAPVLARMQTVDIRLLAPLMLAFFAGAVLLAVGQARARLAPPWIWRLYVLAALVAVAGRIAAKAGVVDARPVALAVLAIASAALAWSGWALRGAQLAPAAAAERTVSE